MNKTALEYVVEHILPNYSDEQLSNMLKQRPHKQSLLRRAILKECGNRCAVEYQRRYGE